MKFMLRGSFLCGFLLFFSLVACKIKPSEAAAQFANPREALIKALKSKLEARSYRTKVVQDTPGADLSSVTEAEYVKPDKVHATVTSLNKPDVKFETILIGQDAYVNSSGQWSKKLVEPEKLGSMTRQDQTAIDNLTKSADDGVTMVGRESVNGKEMVIFHYVSAVDMPGLQSSVKSETKTWIGIADGLPCKTEMKIDATYKGKAMPRMTMTTTVWDYNAEMKIVAPI